MIEATFVGNFNRLVDIYESIVIGLTLFRMGDRIYADRMGGGGKNYPLPP